MASISSLNTLIGSSYTLPEWAGYVVFAFVVLVALFSLPCLIRLLLAAKVDE